MQEITDLLKVTPLSSTRL